MSAALISAKYAKIRQIEHFVVRLAESKPLGKRPLAAKINFSLLTILKRKKTVGKPHDFRSLSTVWKVPFLMLLNNRTAFLNDLFRNLVELLEVVFE